MTIDNVSAGQVIDPDWGNAVADAINELAVTGTYTPTLSGMAVGTGGNAANIARYVFVGGNETGDIGLMKARGLITFGTSGASFPSSDQIVTMPAGFQIYDWLLYNGVGTVNLVDAGTAAHVGTIRARSATTFQLERQLVSGANVLSSSMSTTTPFTWVAGDYMVWDIDVMAVRV